MTSQTTLRAIDPERGQVAAEGPLEAMFRPRGIAVIGASSNPAKMGSVMARSLASYSGPVVLVNERAPNAGAGIHASVQAGAEAVGGPVDLAVLCVPAAVCPEALERAAAAGVRAALVCAGGFAEVGGPGVEAQEALVEVAHRYGVRLLGPNTSGFLVPARGLFATFVPGAREVCAGAVGVVAASGGVNHALAFLLGRAGYGVSVAAGLGNAVDVGSADLIDHLAADPATAAIALHVESVADGPRLLDSIRRATVIKPVVALVVGRADVGDFAKSHTGALATSWKTTRALFRQAGAVIVDDERSLVDAVGALSTGRLRPSADAGVALVTAQAGPGLLVMDDLRAHGVRLPRLGAPTMEALGELLPPMTYQENPVDTGRPAESFADVLTAVSADPDVDLLAVYALSEPGTVDLAEAVRAARDPSVPVVVAVGGVDGEVGPVRDALLADGVGTAADPTGLAVAVRSLVSDARQRGVRTNGAAPPTLPPEASELVAGTGEWTEADAKSLLDVLGLRTPSRLVCDNDDEATRALDQLRHPVAVKLLDAEVLHKTEVGGVHLGIRTRDELDSALARLREAGAVQFLVEEMAPDGVDLLVGVHRDPVFGPVVLLGIGGTVAEALADVTLRAAPLTVEEARTMPGDLLGEQLLHGWRGAPAVDLDELAHVLSTLGQVLTEHPGLTEIEVNPLRITWHGLIALDAVITTRSVDGQQDQ